LAVQANLTLAFLGVRHGSGGLLLAEA